MSLHRIGHPWLWCSARVRILGVSFACKTHNVQYLPLTLGNLLQIHSANDPSFNWSWNQQPFALSSGPRQTGAQLKQSCLAPPSGQIIRKDWRNTAMLSCWVLMQWRVYPGVEGGIFQKFGHCAETSGTSNRYQLAWLCVLWNSLWEVLLMGISTATKRMFEGPVQGIAVNVQDVATMAGFTHHKFPIPSWKGSCDNCMELLNFGGRGGGVPRLWHISPPDGTPKLLRSLFGWRNCALSLGLPFFLAVTSL